MEFLNYDYELYSNGGVYKIFNLLNNRIYIGSTKCFNKRARDHKSVLENKKHNNKFLQNDYLKCGSSYFVFEIIETCEDKLKLLEMEQKYLDVYFDYQINCYNIERFAKYSRAGYKNKNIINSKRYLKQETRDKIKESLKRSWRLNRDKFIDKAILNGLNKWKDYSADILVSNRKTKESILIRGSVREFCLERNISYKSFNQMLNGHIKFSNDWFLGDVIPSYEKQNGIKRKPLTDEHKDKISGGKYKGLTITHKNGFKLILNKNIKKHAQELKINYKKLLRLLKGEIKEVCDWSLICDEQNV